MMQTHGGASTGCTAPVSAVIAAQRVVFSWQATQNSLGANASQA